MLLIIHWFRAFVCTLLIEQLAAGWALRREVPLGRRVALVAVANIASHPAVWLIFPELGAGMGWSRAVTLLVSEVWAFGVEALIYGLFLGSAHARRAVWASVIANTLSLGLGLALRRLGLL